MPVSFNMSSLIISCSKCGFNFEAIVVTFMHRVGVSVLYRLIIGRILILFSVSYSIVNCTYSNIDLVSNEIPSENNQ